MNKTVIKIFCLLILSSVIVGCTKEYNLDSDVEHYITGTVPSSNNTKTTIEKNGESYNVKWASGDKLYVVGKSDYSVPYYYQLQESSIGSKTGQFKSTGAYCTDDSGILACYPMEWCSAYKSDYVCVAIPQNQDLSLKGIAPMIGKGTLADGVNFRHISSVLRLRLYTDVADTYISTIKVSNDDPIAGEIYAPSIGYDESDYIYDFNKKEYTITYNCENIALSTNEHTPTEVDIIVADVPRSNKSLKLSNLTIMITTTDNKAFMVSKSSQTTIPAGNVVIFTPLLCSFQDELIEINYDNSNWEPFAIPVRSGVSSIAVRTGGITEISQSQWDEILLAINSSTVSGGVDVDLSQASFYLSELPESWCLGNHRFKSIKLPQNITKCGNRLMEGCDNLQKISFPAAITNIGLLPGNGCSKFTSFEVAPGNKHYSVVDGVLYNYDKTEICSYPKAKSGTSFSIPNSVKKINQYAFSSTNSNLTTLEIPSSVETIPNWTFNDMKNLNHIYCNWTENVPSVAKSNGCGKNAADRIIHIPNVTGLKSIYTENWSGLVNQEGAAWTIDDGL